MTYRGQREATCENAVVAGAEALGVPSIKLNLKGNRGWPDREFWIPGGRPLLIEFKLPGEEPDPLQAHRHDTLLTLPIRSTTTPLTDSYR